MTSTPEDAMRLIEHVSKHSLGMLFPSKSTAKETYRDLLVLIHPDRFTDAKAKQRAERATQKLAELYSLVNGKVVNAPVLVTLGNWEIESPLTAGDIADLYLARKKKDHTVKAVVKIARDASDNDLINNSHKSLEIIAKRTESQRVYAPQPLQLFESASRAVSVTRHDDTCLLHTLEHASSALPDRFIPFRHVVWMANRSLNLLGLIHRAGIVHGGITPDHLLFDLRTHGLLVAGWGSSVELLSQKHIPVMSKEYSYYYPQEVKRKLPAHPATDIYMLFQCLRNHADAIPVRFKSLFDHCAAESPNARPVDAWAVQERFMKLAEQEYGPPKWIGELILPTQ